MKCGGNWLGVVGSGCELAAMVKEQREAALAHLDLPDDGEQDRAAADDVHQVEDVLEEERWDDEMRKKG